MGFVVTVMIGLFISVLSTVYTVNRSCIYYVESYSEQVHYLISFNNVPVCLFPSVEVLSDIFVASLIKVVSLFVYRLLLNFAV